MTDRKNKDCDVQDTQAKSEPPGGQWISDEHDGYALDIFVGEGESKRTAPADEPSRLKQAA